MKQTLAIFLDAYRELNARKLFWLVLVLSGLIVVAFLAVDITEDGHLKILIWDTPIPITNFVSHETFFKLLFTNLGVQIWLAWIATILALVSTASMIPDFISGGSIDLVLAKPLGRLRLFLTKYLAGLLFVTLQVLVFSVVSFVVIGTKGRSWEPAIFLAVPVVVVFFSYLFAFCVLIGLLTRSAITSLILTLLFWILIFAVHVTEQAFYLQRVTEEVRVEATEREIQVRDDYLVELRATEDPASNRMKRLEEILDRRRTQLPENTARRDRWRRWHTFVFRLKTALPKTAETIELLERWMVDLAEMPDPGGGNGPDPGLDLAALTDPGQVRVDGAVVQQRVIEGVRERSTLWVIGTSLLCEFVLLGLASWIFCRRDF